MCAYGDRCNNRTNCRFAHSHSELRHPVCMFGENCTKKPTCKYRHPSETGDEYTSRMNAM